MSFKHPPLKAIQYFLFYLIIFNFVHFRDGVDYMPSPLLKSDQNKPKKVLRLPQDHAVTMVDSEEMMRRCVEILAQAHVVGIDTEWKPAFCAETETLSLLQISTYHETFLIDVIGLQNSAIWKELSRVLFASPEVLKLGMNFPSKYHD